MTLMSRLLKCAALLCALIAIGCTKTGQVSDKGSPTDPSTGSQEALSSMGGQGGEAGGGAGGGDPAAADPAGGGTP
jgi:hypothetical protein